MIYLLKFWREGLILILLAVAAGSIRACNQAKEDTQRVIAEQKILADEQIRKNKEQERQDQQAKEDAKRDYQNQIDELNSDHRVASLKCVRNSASRSAVPREAAPAPGAAAEAQADNAPAVVDDIGPELDAITRECDAVIVQNNALIDWVLATR